MWNTLGENPDDIKRGLPEGVQTYPADAAISVFDTVVYDNPWPIRYHKLSLNTRRATWGWINSVLDPRIQQCVRDVEDAPERFVMVEGIFPFTKEHSMYVFAKMEYQPTAPKHETYAVVSSVFRTG